MKQQTSAGILVVDDENNILDVINEALASDKYTVKTLADPEQAIAWLSENPVDLVLTDMVMGKYSGVHILDAALAHQSNCVVILMTAHPTVEMAISVLKRGMYDFLVKPFKLDLLRSTISRALAHQRILRENVHLRSQVKFLKVFSAYALGIEIDQVFDLIVKSCKDELDAEAVGLVEIEPKTKKTIRSAWAAADPVHKDTVLDNTLFEKFVGKRKAKPIIEARRLRNESRKRVRVTIIQPIFIRRTLHGFITLLIDSPFGQITPGQLDVLTILTNSAAAAIANYNLYQDRQNSYMEAITGLANAIEARDKYTAGHTDRVSTLTRRLAQELGWSDKQLAHLVMGCTLHDIGKLSVPDSILNKPARLSEDEVRHMRCHPELGLKVIRGIELFKPAMAYIYAHHERWDGKGYPEGLRAEEIPIEGRLLAVTDTFDAMMSDRPYRRGSALGEAVAELQKYRGIQFDPKIVDLFVKILCEGKIDLKALYDIDEDPADVSQAVPRETVSA